MLGGMAAAALGPIGLVRAAEVDPASFSGPDREQRLIAGARKEGVVNLYSSAITEHLAAVHAAFGKKYGIKVQLWRGGSEEILQRVVTEYRGRRYEVDVVETGSHQMVALDRESAFQKVQTPAAAGLTEDTHIAGASWYPTRLIVFTGAYNTKLIRKADLPTSYEGFLDPKWKGKLGIEAEDSNWLMALSGSLGEERATSLLRGLARNGLSVRKGHTLMSGLVASGEVPVALTVYYHEVVPLKRAGAPIDALGIAPSFTFAAGAGLAKRAPHPHASVLYLDFLLGEGQAILAAHGNVPSRTAVQALPPELKLAFIDVPKYMGENAKWNRLYKSSIVPAR